jgi:hypothetical protein
LEIIITVQVFQCNEMSFRFFTLNNQIFIFFISTISLSPLQWKTGKWYE